ncbi:amidohydrolase family protein [Rhodopirellula baltica]
MPLSKPRNRNRLMGESTTDQPASSDVHLTRRGFVTSTVAVGASAMAESVTAAPSPKEDPIPIIDCHIHLFDGSRPQGAPYVGPGGDSPTTALPADYRKLAVPLGITGAIKVEASPWVEDNLWALQVMQPDDMMLGLVGNLRPEKPDFAELLVRHAKNPLFRGIRYGTLWGYDLPRMVEDDVFLKGMRLMTDLDLSLDVANPSVRLLEAVVKLNQKLPDLRIIIDHLPRLERTVANQTTYEDVLKDLHDRTNVYVKLSGVIHHIAGKIVKDLEVHRPNLDRLIKIFGDDRILFGSDWPNSDRAAPLDEVVGIAKEYFADKPRELQEKYFWKNSLAAYKWKPREDQQER